MYDLRFLSAPEDRITLRSTIRLCMRVVQEMRSSGYPTRPFRAPTGLDDASVDAFIEENSLSFFHYSSTCRMAALDDIEDPGVVDDELKVHGISNLRVCDASVFPQVPAAHLQAPVIAVAERCADMIRGSQ